MNFTKVEHVFVGSTWKRYKNFPIDGANASGVKKWPPSSVRSKSAQCYSSRGLWNKSWLRVGSRPPGEMVALITYRADLLPNTWQNVNIYFLK